MRWRVGAAALLLGVARFVSAGSAGAGCLDQQLSPAAPGHNGPGGPSLYADFLALVNALYLSEAPNGATKTLVIDNEVFQVPPWFESSTECTEVKLRQRDGTPSSFSDYLLDGDELSELMIVTALADNDARMLALHRTVQKLIAGSSHAGVPCYRARVRTSPPSIQCFRTDSATDITARVALAYYYAAANPRFPCSSRSLYRLSADTIAGQHLTEEYVNLLPGSCLTSGVTGHLLCNWIANGGGSSQNELMSELVMLIGYHQDVVRMLHAAFHATGDQRYLERAEEVVDQWLVASTFSGPADTLSVGRKQFKWNTSTGTPVPVEDPNDDYHWEPGNPPWDDADAPRALWMGDVVRSLLLTSRADAANLPPAYAILRDWVKRIQMEDDHLASGSCVQLNLDGSCFANFGDDYWVNGLGMGLHMEVNPAELDEKLAPILSQFGWTNHKKWNDSHQCFGIYRGIRPLKALASAIGLDAPAYGVAGCARDYFTVSPCRLLDTRQGAGALQSGEVRMVNASGLCGIPATATALAVNVTVVQPTAGGHISVGNDSCRLGETSTLTFSAGQTRANNAIIRLTRDGLQRFLATALAPGGQAHLVVDVNGYFE
jgi:hypothetical protein